MTDGCKHLTAGSNMAKEDDDVNSGGEGGSVEQQQVLVDKVEHHDDSPDMTDGCKHLTAGSKDMAKEDDDVNNGGEGGSVEQQQVLVDKVEHTYIHMAASSSTSDLGYNEVDDSYIAALIDDDEIFPISDEKYAEELQLQEALISSSSLLNIPSPKNDIASSSNTKPQPLVDSFESNQSPKNFCDICMDTKTESEMFGKINVCSHLFCFDCIRGHVASKIKQNITTVTCPDPKCNEVIGLEACKTVVPQEVLERWENTLCESLIMESEKFYCPFKDCSVMLVDDGGEHVTSSECPHCNRLFCAQCKVTWHSGMDCSEFQSLKENVRDSTDIMLMDLAKNKKWRRCPSCKFYVERTEGCLHITCRCGYHFCYGCGEKHTSEHACA